MKESLRKEILARDGQCRICEGEKYLQVHHFADIVEHQWLSAYVTEVPDLLVTLCRKCHGRLHGKGGGKKKWEIRRKLILLLFGKDIGPCERHRWVHIDGKTRCENCKLEKDKEKPK
jgi:hypothetical protein